MSAVGIKLHTSSSGSIGCTMFEALLWFALACILVAFTVRRFSGPKNLPPGPFQWPVIGNMHQLTSAFRHLELMKMEKRYGRVFRLYLGGQLIVVISGKAVKEALITKSVEFAGRPSLHTADIYSHDGKAIIFGQYSPRWKLNRKIVHSALKMYSTGLLKLDTLIHKEINLLSKRLESSVGRAHDITSEIRLAVMNVICALVFGSRFELDDPKFRTFIEITARLAALVSAGSIVDVFPWLEIFPFKSLKLLREVCEERDKIVSEVYREHVQANRVDKPYDLTDALLKTKKDAEEEDSSTKGCLTDQHLIMMMSEVFIAGFETTSSTLNWAIIYLLHNPKVQDKAHQELDRVIGPDRLPVLKDKNSLPYLEAVITETLRVSSLVPLAVPHQTTEDTTLEGYFIPKGTTVLPNLWSLHHDPTLWEDPDNFRPERFLDDDGSFVPPRADSFLPFSTGRRVCLGESLARRQIFLVLAQLLHCFKFETPPGRELPTLEPNPGIALIPYPFTACAVKRHTF